MWNYNVASFSHPNLIDKRAPLYISLEDQYEGNLEQRLNSKIKIGRFSLLNHEIEFEADNKEIEALSELIIDKEKFLMKFSQATRHCS